MEKEKIKSALEHEKRMEENEKKHNLNMNIMQCQHEYNMWKQNKKHMDDMMEQQKRYNNYNDYNNYNYNFPNN